MKVQRAVGVTLALTVMLRTLSANACGVCGCVVGVSPYMGIIPFDNQSTFGFLYRYRVMSGLPGSGGNPFSAPAFSFQSRIERTPALKPVREYEAHRTIEFRGRWFVHRRVELNVSVPVAMAAARTSGMSLDASGLGDVSFWAGYHAVRKIGGASPWRHRLIVGAGAKIPTGDYYRKDETGARLPPLMQPGSGSWDALFNAVYVAGFYNWGAMASATYKHNGQNYYLESMGDVGTGFGSLFYVWTLPRRVSFVPSAQAFYERAGGPCFNGRPLYENRRSHVFMAGGGLDFFWRNVSLNASFVYPVVQAVTDAPGHSGQLVVGLAYNVPQNRYFWDQVFVRRRILRGTRPPGE